MRCLGIALVGHDSLGIAASRFTDEDVERNVASEGLGVDALFSNAERHQFGAGRRASSNCAAAERYVVFCGYAERSTWPR